MGTLAAVGFALAGLALLAASATLYSRKSMAALPLYDAADAENPVALARVVAVSLAAFGVFTLVFAALETLDATTETVVAAYTVAVMAVAVLTAGVTRTYE